MELRGKNFSHTGFYYLGICSLIPRSQVWKCRFTRASGEPGGVHKRVGSNGLDLKCFLSYRGSGI